MELFLGGSLTVVHQKLGGRNVFKCGGCSLKIDRDINGARGIFLRALLDGAIFL